MITARCFPAPDVGGKVRKEAARAHLLHFFRRFTTLTVGLAVTLTTGLALAQASGSGTGTQAGSASTTQAGSSAGPAAGASGCGNTDNAGTPTCGQEAGNPINVTNGNKFQREVDMPPLPGVLGLELIRHYNSSQSRLTDAPGLFGRGWRLSYDWQLRFNHAAGNETLVLVKGDGTELGLRKRRSGQHWDGSLWPVGRPDGRLEEIRVQARTEYLWTTLNGQRYRFSDRGLLASIEAPTGEVLSIEREHKGDITRVTDPQGRELRFEVLSDARALRDKIFGGAQAVTTPVGRYVYRYGGEAPANSKVVPERLLSRLLSVDHAGIRRAYLYEDARQPGLLTGIQVSGKGSDGVVMNQRIATWAYDDLGRAVLSIRGEDKPAAGSVPSSPDRQLTNGTAQDTSAPERVSLQFLPTRRDALGRETGTTLLRNSLGQITLYRFAKIQGRAELTEVIGSGCASCGPTNVRHVYDARGKLLETMALAPVTIAREADGQAALQTKAGEVLDSLAFSYDEEGRLVRREKRTWVAGKAQPVTHFVRLAYGPGAFPLNWMPATIAQPSVQDGMEAVSSVRRNAQGQVLSIEETGFSPSSGASPYVPLRRIITYRYRDLNGRSVLLEIDGPLPNGPKASPEDSDITRMDWDEQGMAVRTINAPGGYSTTIKYDAAGRVTASEAFDGHRKITTTLSYAEDGRHAFHLARKNMQGELVRAKPDDAGRTVRIQPFEARYDALGRMTLQRDAAGREVRREYDAANRLATLADAQGNRSQQTFDGEGHLLRSALYRAGQTGLLRASYFWHDDQGRMTARLLPDGRLDTWTFGPHGDPGMHIDGDDVRTTFLQSKDRLIRASVRQTGDGEASWRIGRAAQHPRGVDDFGQRVAVVLPDHGNQEASYDEGGRLISIRRADGSQITFLHDVAGRVMRTRYVDRNGKVQSEATSHHEGLVQTALDDNELSTRYSADALGRRLGQAITIKALEKEYRFSHRIDEDTGLTREHTLADGRLLDVQRSSAQDGRTVRGLSLRPAWVSDLRTRLATLLPTDWLAWADDQLPSEAVISKIEVDPFNGLSAFTMGNGIKTQRHFDIAGRLTRQTTDRLGTLTYRHTTGPRIRAITTEPAREGTTPPSDATAHTVRYDYTGFGQLKKGEAVERLHASLNASDMAQTIKASTTPNPPRDALGRATEDDRHRFSYTIAGQLSEVRSKHDDRLIARYRYDSQHRRVSKTVFPEDATERPKVSYFLWQDQTLVGEMDEKGRITSQYLYLKEGGPAQAGPGMVVAKLESAINPDNTAGKARMLFVHADHRGSPLSISDATGPIKARINIAWPGQYSDGETGLADNLHRTYNAKTGRYLQPDPLGYFDNNDPYLYAGGDPINKSDPLGLYEEDVHYYLMVFLARVAGISKEAAHTIGMASQYIDDNPLTKPILDNGAINVPGLGTERPNTRALPLYHFTRNRFDDAWSAPENRIFNPTSNQLDQLKAPAMNSSLPACARNQFFGEYLHAFADAFAHRDQSNIPFFFSSTLGHGAFNHDPDQTYNIRDFSFNEMRTIEMAKETYAAMRSFGGASAAPDWSQVQPAVLAFARTGSLAARQAPRWQDRDDPNAYAARKAAELAEKKQVLDGALVALGLGSLTPTVRASNGAMVTLDYSSKLAESSRLANLSGITHFAPGNSRDRFPGVLLPEDK